ncbi:MAG: hypothetical protein GY798_17595 [Hyphomicrobiales bacterium]|nr:hypothetical protein [Hyphomicrobiales bacterium]
MAGHRIPVLSSRIVAASCCCGVDDIAVPSAEGRRKTVFNEHTRLCRTDLAICDSGDGGLTFARAVEPGERAPA